MFDPKRKLQGPTGHGSSWHAEILGLREVLRLKSHVKYHTFLTQYGGKAPLGVDKCVGWQAGLVIGLDVTQSHHLGIYRELVFGAMPRQGDVSVVQWHKYLLVFGTIGRLFHHGFYAIEVELDANVGLMHVGLRLKRQLCAGIPSAAGEVGVFMPN